MKNEFKSSQRNHNDDFRNKSTAEIQRRFVDLQFQRSELEKQLKRINEVLLSLGREMEEHIYYDQFINKY